PVSTAFGWPRSIRRTQSVGDLLAGGQLELKQAHSIVEVCLVVCDPSLVVRALGVGQFEKARSPFSVGDACNAKRLFGLRHGLCGVQLEHAAAQIVSLVSLVDIGQRLKLDLRQLSVCLFELRESLVDFALMIVVNKEGNRNHYADRVLSAVALILAGNVDVAASKRTGEFERVLSGFDVATRGDDVGPGFERDLSQIGE